jgi:CheY-like chemotaxis protein
MSGARVLVVDDDAAILRAVQRGLEGAGVDV